MSSCYITEYPCTIEAFIQAAKAEDFTVTESSSGSVSMIHDDGRGCFAASEEDWGDVYVGSMNNPRLDGIPMVEEGSEQYREICGDEFEDEADDGKE